MNTCIDILKREMCTGCGTCKNICPVGAVSMETDAEGFWYPVIDQYTCIRCGKCTRVCPVSCTAYLQAPSRQKERIKVYAAWSLDRDVRYHSTSGGIFSEFAAAVMNRNGVVCGAAYDGEQMVCHKIVDRKEELGQIRQSKYVQSDMGDVYREIASRLRQGQEVLFCGTPCQCAGVYRYCGEENIAMDQLYLIDFICRGSNSPKVYRKFLDELEALHQSKTKKVWFKNKAYGWNCFSTRIEFENGACYLEDRYHDLYIRGYIEENLYIRPSCSNCEFKGLRRVSDVTLGDFWGVDLKENMREGDGGTSMVMLHTRKGQELWHAIRHNVYQVKKEIEEVIAGNVCFENSVEPGRGREDFMKKLDSISVIENIERFVQ
ncbi:MAG: 4Fe-4S binding protein [Lachnospiraceae bacterium]|nr:4Fe-4S binding protein [Lachnospiraceae bacterium]